MAAQGKDVITLSSVPFAVPLRVPRHYVADHAFLRLPLAPCEGET
jgi:hypothetical protein